MRIGYLDCFSGISGDMCLGALVDAGVPLTALAEALRTLPVRGYELFATRVVRSGVAATRVEVRLDESHHPPARGLSDVLAVIEGGALSDGAVARSSAVFRALAEAEARVHGVGLDKAHFHEVGAVDAICDVVGTAVGIEELGLDALMFSTVAVGGGTVKCAHGILPVPAPATAELLKGLPTAGGPLEVELTTPTGAAILKALGEPCPGWPPMSVTTVGYGAGARTLVAVPNMLRLVVGESVAAEDAETDCVWVLETNLDDATGQEVAYCSERLLAEGALDVFVTPVQMKKNRPGVLLTVLCEPGRLAAMEEVIYRHTPTFGVRRSLWQRSKLRRRVREVPTPWGPVRVKEAMHAGRRVRWEPEYDDCRRIAEANGVTLRQVRMAALSAAGENELEQSP